MSDISMFHDDVLQVYDATDKPDGLLSKYVKMAKDLDRESESRQSKIDSLMFEFCPDEMTKEQVENWEKHQVVSEIIEIPGCAEPVAELSASVEHLVSELNDKLERWENYRLEMENHKKRLVKLSVSFLEREAFDDVAKCAITASGLQYVFGRMPTKAH